MRLRTYTIGPVIVRVWPSAVKWRPANLRYFPRWLAKCWPCGLGYPIPYLGVEMFYNEPTLNLLWFSIGLHSNNPTEST